MGEDSAVLCSSWRNRCISGTGVVKAPFECARNCVTVISGPAFLC